MAALIARIRTEPAVLAALVAIAATIGVSVPAGQNLDAVVISVVEGVLGLVVRHFVTPTSKPAAAAAPSAPTVLPHG